MRNQSPMPMVGSSELHIVLQHSQLNTFVLSDKQLGTGGSVCGGLTGDCAPCGVI